MSQLKLIGLVNENSAAAYYYTND